MPHVQTIEALVCNIVIPKPTSTVYPVTACILHRPLHKRAQGGVGGRLYEQMKIIGHEAEAEDLDGEFGFRRGEQVEKCGVVAVLVEDRGATIPTVEHMVGVSGHFSAWNPRHGKSTVRETGVGTR